MENKNKQGTKEWLELRRGKITASGVSDLMKSGRKKDEVFGVTAQKYIMERYASGLVDSEPEITSAAMQWGKDHEDEARDLYIANVVSKNKNNRVEEIGFCHLKGFETIAGSSPDGLVIDYNKKDDELIVGCIEIKCPYTSMMHVETLINKDFPATYKDKYYAQCQMNMLTTGTQWCDFISYDPRMKNKNQRLVVVRVELDLEFCNDLVNRLKIVKEQFKEWDKILGENVE